MTELQKVYLVIDTPHGDFETVYGIFTTKEKADDVCDHYPQTLCTGPYVKEIMLDVEKDWWNEKEESPQKLEKKLNV